ncbi:ubiquitin- ligase E3B isoform X2 [Brachionus plicatilis]|uniref:HECT-type E3 ubiquitin transferase n=1 Tax=Brachionus plicatilis TaxID=10195 RepID=A0A3M7T785_BRAPC|nr:ubiquitin- ligase E3B isoform X2 [Brachionus plicatilis]
MFSQNSSDKESFIRQANEARERRTLEKKKLSSAIRIQALYRGYRARKTIINHIESELNNAFCGIDVKDVDSLNSKSYLSKQLFNLINRFLFLNNLKHSNRNSMGKTLVLNLSSYLILNITNSDFKHSYMGLILSKDNFQSFLGQTHKILKKFINIMHELNIKDLNDYRIFTNLINFFTILCDSKYWKCFPTSNRNEMLEKTLQEISKNYTISLKNNSFFEKLMIHMIQNSKNHVPIIKPNTFNYIFNLTFNVLDENEFYVEQKVLKLNDYKQIANFLNNLLYHVVANGLIDLKLLDQDPYFTVFHQLLFSLYVKDCRRSFTDKSEFWTIKEMRIKNFMEDLEKESKNALFIINKIPHVVPLKYRIEILKNKIEKDKQIVLGEDCSSLKISIRRNRLVEDAYRNLSSLSSNLLKSPIRITFINEFGLKEAGIDQDGVFKEFLQQTIQNLLNPEFNLFKLTSDQFLYPSAASYFVEDHLQMFQFAGKLIAKAVYESLVIDTEFAPFFLRQIAGYRSQFSYSFLDDLVTLDQDLYKNLNFIKHDQNVDDLELNFTHSEHHLGKLITHELVPSGELIKVTNTNKIKYIHLMAHFKLHRQIKDQINAFNEGFKSIIRQDWINMFSVTEIQRLISGCLNDLNIEDLKKNVQYWGGLHSSHRLVKWLWEIVENDFDQEEKSLFLKFVTSSPKPPLMGFSTLNPQFTIRCVEAEEEEGTIYDSSLKGFFKTLMNIGGTNTSRLPTSSTCFNLLKLPNYSKKSTLRDKLRYAIRSNSGFELS